MLEPYQLFLEQFTFWGNTAWEYVVAGAMFIGLLIVLKLFQLVLVGKLKRLAKKTKSNLDDMLVEVAGNIRPSLYILISLYIPLQYLVVHPWIGKTVEILFLIVVIAQFVTAIESLATFSMKAYLKKRNHDNENQNAMVNMGMVFIRITLWSLGLLFLLSNLGVNVSSLIASLGIGGIAIAFALQNLLSDVFSSFSILFDKPFSIGDFIIVGQDSGVVQKIGLKTTRIKTLRGEEMIISNKDLTSARVQNLKTMERRREVLKFGVEFGTDLKLLKKIPEFVQGVIEKEKEATFDRCHFINYGESSLEFEAVYYVETADYHVYLNTKQDIHYALLDLLEKKGIHFAYPTQTVYVKK